MTLNLVLIDDESSERHRLTAILEGLSYGHFGVKAVPPPNNLNEIDRLAVKADIFLVDYELDTRIDEGQFANYRGSTLASRVREKTTEIPTVLLTRSDLQIWKDGQRALKAMGVFDHIMFKTEDLVKCPNKSHARLVSLARGYKTLRQLSARTVDALMQALNVDQVGQELCLKTTPPKFQWSVVEAAHWTRKVLLQYPGILYDSNHTSTALGISYESFQTPKVQELFIPAKYTGVFVEDHTRWWKHRVLDIANDILLDHGGLYEITEDFRVAAGERIGMDLQPSIDEESGLSPADTVCYEFGIPVRIETSLPYQPDDRPRMMDEARLSFRAIKESNEIVEEYFDRTNRSFLPEIRRFSDES